MILRRLWGLDFAMRSLQEACRSRTNAGGVEPPPAQTFEFPRTLVRVNRATVPVGRELRPGWMKHHAALVVSDSLARVSYIYIFFPRCMYAGLVDGVGVCCCCSWFFVVGGRDEFGVDFSPLNVSCARRANQQP